MKKQVIRIGLFKKISQEAHLKLGPKNFMNVIEGEEVTRRCQLGETI